MGQGKGHPTLSQLMWHVPDAIAAEGVPQVSGDCHHDQEISVDENGYPTIFGSILSAEVAVDEDGYPIIFGAIIAGGNEAMQDDDSLPSIKPINPNGRARKLEVNAAAKALQEDDVANGVAPPVKKKMKGKQSSKAQTLKAKMIQKWHPQEAEAKPKAVSKAKAKPKTKAKAKAKPKPVSKAKAKGDEPQAVGDEPQAEGDAQAQQVGTACKRGIKNSDAVILSAYGSSNASTGRFDIQGKCKLKDGSNKVIGILGFSEKEPFGHNVWQALLKKMNEESGEHTKGDMFMLRDELIACCKAGQPC